MIRYMQGEARSRHELVPEDGLEIVDAVEGAGGLAPPGAWHEPSETVRVQQQSMKFRRANSADSLLHMVVARYNGTVEEADSETDETGCGILVRVRRTDDGFI